MVIHFNGLDIIAKETQTEGNHTYLVGLRCGGIMEMPEFHWKNPQIIRANTRRKAIEKYNELNNCNYFYGGIMKEIE